MPTSITAAVAAAATRSSSGGDRGVPTPYRQLWRQLDTDCGSGWQQNYVDLHNDVMAGRRPERIVVSVATATGLADRLLGTMSAFYYALLTGRAFQVQTFGEVPSFELALASNRIDWRRPPDGEELLRVVWNDSTPAARWEDTPFGPGVDTNRYAYVRQGEWQHINEAAPDEMFLRGNMSTLPAQNPVAPVVLFSSNRGRTVHMFENPYHGQQLRDWGLTPETAFTCAFMFFFKPQPAVARQARPSVTTAAAAAQRALKIGVHLRLGDAEMAGGGLSHDEVEQRSAAVWKCVQDIEARQKGRDQPVLWYLVSDSLTARRAAKERFGDKLVTDTQVAAVHVGCDSDAGCRNNATRKAHAMQCVPVNSGFGKIAAFLASPQKAIYTMPGYSWEGYQPRSCGVGDADSVFTLADNWSGF